MTKAIRPYNKFGEMRTFIFNSQFSIFNFFNSQFVSGHIEKNTLSFFVKYFCYIKLFTYICSIDRDKKEGVSHKRIRIEIRQRGETLKQKNECETFKNRPFAEVFLRRGESSII